MGLTLDLRGLALEQAGTAPRLRQWARALDLRVSDTEARLRGVGGAVRVLKRHARGAAGAAR